MKKRVFIIIITFIIVVLIGTTKYIFLNNDPIYAMNVSETLSQIGENNFINRALREKIKIIEEKKAQEIVKKAREEKKAEDERQKALEDEKNREGEITEIRESKIPKPKIAYLTFDDGPSHNATPQILEILDDYGIKATFFILGSRAEQNPNMLKRIYDDGHKIGNHSYSHNYKYIYKNTDNFLLDFKRCEDVLKGILGEDFSTNIIRFPGGTFGQNKGPMIAAAVESGYNYYDWNSLNGDAENIELNKSYLLKRLRDTVGNKEKAIILMHDLDSKMETVETLRASIDYLIQKGYSFEVLN